MSTEVVDSGEAVVKKAQMREKRRRMFCELPACTVRGYAPICVDTNDPETQYQGLVARLLRPVPKARPLSLVSFARFVDRFITERVLTGKLEMLTFEEYLQGNKSYNEERKQQLREAFDALRGGRPTKAQCRAVSSFIKVENYPDYKHARWINSRSDKFKAYAACYLKPIENLVFSLPWFIKHTPVPERPEKISDLRQAGRRYFATDYTAFESHFVRDLMQACEIRLYERCLAHTTEGRFLSEALCGTNDPDWLNNHLKTRLGTEARLRARRMSGDLVTSLGNGFTNLMLALYHAERSCGSWEGNIDGFVEGDDGIFSCAFEMRKEFYEDMGFTIKIEEHTDPRRASFCGLVFEDDAIIRDPRTFLMSFGWTSSMLGAGWGIKMSLLRAKALSAAYETPDCPIVAEMARYALRYTRGVLPRWVSDGYHVLPRDESHVRDPRPSAGTRRLFAELYGIPEDQQLVIEAAIRAGDMRKVSVLLPAPAASATYEAAYVVVGT